MIVCLDLETTGFDPKLDEIIEVALVKFDEKTGEVIDTFTSLVLPKNGIPEVIKAITSIDEEVISNAPSFESIRKEIEEFIGDNPILGHNVGFDRGFLRSKGISLSNNRLLDTFIIANFLYFSVPSLSLESLCKEFGIIQENAHRALDDVTATINLFLHMKKEIMALEPYKKVLLVSVFGLSVDQDIVLLRQVLGLENVEALSFQGFQDTLIANFLKTPLSQAKNGKIDESYKEVLSKFSQYSHRNNQEVLYSIFEKTIGKGAKYVIEAPTGVGKTFSYLIPSLKYALEKGKQVIISTKTKILQDQIVDYDLKEISEKLGVEILVTKLKGKKNYISLYNFFDFLQSRQFNSVEISFISKITFWLLKTKNGEIDELNLYGDEVLLVDNVNIQSLEILSPKNPYLMHEFYKKVIEKINFSQIVVVNHNFVFSDLQKKNRALLKYETLVFDEAHNLEDIGTDSLKVSYNKFSFSSYIAKFSFSSSEANIASEVLFLFDELDDAIIHQFGILTGFQNTEKRQELILPSTSLESLLPLFANIRIKLQSFKKTITENHIGEYDDGEYIETLSSFFEKISNQEAREKGIFYYSYDIRNRLSLFLTEKFIGNFLKENLWDKVKNVYLLSATMSVDEDFTFIKNVLSLEDFSSQILHTDFDYKNQAKLFIPSDLGDIKRNLPLMISFLGRLSQKVRGKMLVLFTSLSTVRQAYLGVYSLLKQDTDIHLLAQGIHGGKTKILENFKRDGKNTIVFGTDSFWEGVDIPGENLTYLIIHKLPFPVPTDPIFVARGALYKNSFLEYAVPKTILKLKQGFGRLIRTKTDIGFIVLLDNRVIETEWGKKFFSAFPKDISFEVATEGKIIDSIGTPKI